MKELNTVNTLLGGHKISIEGIKKIACTNKSITVCEIGCGGGDNLYAIANWCKKNNITASFIGIDIKTACIDFARQQYPSLNTNWITSDYAKVDLTQNKPSIIFSSLFCHHFTNEELSVQLKWMKEKLTEKN